MARAVVAVYKRDGRVLNRFGSIQEAADFYGFGRSHINKMLAKQTMPRGAVFFRYEEDWDGFEEYPNPHVAPVIVTDLKSGISTWHASTKSACECYFLSAASANKAISRGTVIDGRFLFRRQKSTADFKEVQDD